MHVRATIRQGLLRWVCFLLIVAAGSGCDLQTKSWAEHTLGDPPGMAMTLVEPYLDLTLAYNRGSAFSLIPDFGFAQQALGAS